MNKRLSIPLILVLLCCGAARAASAGDCTGVWKMRNLLVTAEANVEQKGDRIRGIAFVYGFTGRIDRYHFAGTIREGVIQASHSDGHSFQGRVEGPERISGVLTTRTGIQIEMKAERNKPQHASESSAADRTLPSP